MQTVPPGDERPQMKQGSCLDGGAASSRKVPPDGSVSRTPGAPGTLSPAVAAGPIGAAESGRRGESTGALEVPCPLAACALAERSSFESAGATCGRGAACASEAAGEDCANCVAGGTESGAPAEASGTTRDCGTAGEESPTRVTCTLVSESAAPPEVACVASVDAPSEGDKEGVGKTCEASRVPSPSVRSTTE